MPGWGVDGELQDFSPQTLLLAPSQGELLLFVPPSPHPGTRRTRLHTHTHTHTHGIPSHCDVWIEGIADHGRQSCRVPV